MEEDKSKRRDVPPILKTLGVKSAAGCFMNFLRLVLVGCLCYSVVMLILKSNKPRKYTLQDLDGLVPPETILHKSACELNEDLQSAYIMSIRKSLEPPPMISKKLSRTVMVSIITAMLSEFIISGNVTKPSNVVAKTFIFTVLNTLLN